MSREAIADLLASPWRTAIGMHGPLLDAEEDSEIERSGHAERWAVDLRIGDLLVLVTSDPATARACKGPWLRPLEFALLCAAAELERTNPTHVREILTSLPRLRRPIGWALFEPGSGLSPATAGTWTIAAVLARIGATLTGARVVERATVEAA